MLELHSPYLHVENEDVPGNLNLRITTTITLSSSVPKEQHGLENVRTLVRLGTAGHSEGWAIGRIEAVKMRCYEGIAGLFVSRQSVKNNIA